LKAIEAELEGLKRTVLEHDVDAQVAKVTELMPAEAANYEV
jgi:hypothetical protein